MTLTRHTPLRRTKPMRKSRGTQWPEAVRLHVREHQGWGCIGPEAGMPEPCVGPGIQLDHVRPSGALGMKSPSIPTNAARLCVVHHEMKTNAGETWRPALLRVIAHRHGACSVCQREAITTWGGPLETLA